MEIRVIQPDEVAVAHDVIRAAGMGMPLGELALTLALQPGCYLAAIDNGAFIGTVGALRYNTCAFVCGMAVRPEQQGRGVGRALLTRLLAQLEQQGFSLLLLEATTSGYPLYASLGFIPEYPTLIFSLDQSGDSGLQCQLPRELVEPLDSADLEAVVALDASCFGADRGEMLARRLANLPGRAFLTRDRHGQVAGYLIAQQQRIGPWVASDPASGSALLDAALTLHFEQPPIVAVPEPNRAGVALLQQAGFSLKNQTTRMRRGSGQIATNPVISYGLASMGMG